MLLDVTADPQPQTMQCNVMDVIRAGFHNEGSKPGQPEPKGDSTEVDKAWDENRFFLEKEIQVHMHLREVRNSKLEVEALLRASQNEDFPSFEEVISRSSRGRGRLTMLGCVACINACILI